jgi:hypothetical protein
VTAELPVVISALHGPLAALERKQVEPLLVRARLADWLRDAGLPPPDPDQVTTWVAALDAEGWRRLALLATAMELDAVSSVVGRLAARHDAAWLVKEGLIGVAAATPLLTVALLRESAVRLEELARAWLAALGASIVGEAPAESEERWQRIDYGRLLAEADRAKKEAEQRMAELRERQERAERMRAGRSKW